MRCLRDFADVCVLTIYEETDMTINNTTVDVFGQLALIEPQPDLGEASLNRAIAGFLAGYSGTTLVAYRLDLRQWIEWLNTFNNIDIGTTHSSCLCRIASSRNHRK